jgi:alkylated DNA repair dioxygenase AlkB
VLSRGYRQFGVAYASSGARLPAADPVPDILVPVIARAQAASGHRFDASYCVVMHYPPGTGIGWHVDGKRFRDVLLVVSLGGSAGVEFRTVGGNATSSKWDLGHGSLYAMYGTARWEYEHRVLPVTEERFCLQFRDVDSAAGMAQPAGEA